MIKSCETLDPSDVKDDAAHERYVKVSHHKNSPIEIPNFFK